MAEERPPPNSSPPQDEQDFVQIRPLLFRQISGRDLTTKIATKSLTENGAIRDNASHTFAQHVSKMKTETTSEFLGLNDLCESYLRFNRMNQEQNFFKKMVGPNYLEAILNKPKARLPDVNEAHIDEYDTDIKNDGIIDDDEENQDMDGRPIHDGLRGTLKPGVMETIDGDFECFDYTETSSALQYRHAVHRPSLDILTVDFGRWVIALMIGIVTAFVALAIQATIEFIAEKKYNILSYWFQWTYETDHPHYGYLISVGINICMCTIAALCCALAPEAVGSGIPQIKSYLNGVNVPRLMRFKTLMGKTVGVVFSVTGGLAVGKEGPMIHSGAVIAAGLSQGKATSLPITTRFNKAYRTDSEKRDFVACGAASGVAAAFGAPLGGLLFAIEEGASHINHSTLWRVAMASITSYFTLNMVNSVRQGTPGQLSSGGLISFGEFDNAQYSLYQILIFGMMGIVGGLLGSLFNYLNEELTKFRVRKMTTKFSKCMEVILCGISVATMAFTMMYLIDDCRSYDVDINQAPVRLFCQDGKASAAASLWYKTPEETVRSLFHDQTGAHSFFTVSVFTFIYFFLACWTYGMFISSGLFVPSLLIGAAWGRLIGMFLTHNFPAWDWGDLGKYALMGAAAQLAGTIRLTYSLTAIILEATGNISYIFPIFITVFIAKIVGDLLNEGLYDIHINIMGIPLLPYQPKVELRTITAKDMMNDNVKYLNIRSNLRDVMELLMSTTHNGFPVVDTELRPNSDGSFTYGRFRGLMTRHDIVTMIQHRLYVENNKFGVEETYPKLREGYPRFKKLEDIHVPPEHLGYTLDFSNCLNAAPYTVSSMMSMPAVYSLFRNMGMRHLVVTNIDNEVVGMITRKEIAALHPEFAPFPRSSITLYKKTLIIPHQRTFEQKRGGLRKRRVTFTQFDDYQRLD